MHELMSFAKCACFLFSDHSYMLDLSTPVEEKLTETEKMSSTLDLSKKELKKVPKPDDGQHVRVLILDENRLQKIDNIDSFLKVEKVCSHSFAFLLGTNTTFFHSTQLSLCKNNLLRMYGVSRLHNLQELYLSNNGIITIEGLKELVQLRHLDLQSNNIKTIEHLGSNHQLEYLNLAENSIGNISDVSMLKNLKVRHSHRILYEF